MLTNALIMMLFNIPAQTYHPIFYIEKQLPGTIEELTFIRYQSQGHHTTGFKELKDALAEANEVKGKLEAMHYTVIVEVDNFLPWDGQGVPTDHQIRPISYVIK